MQQKECGKNEDLASQKKTSNAETQVFFNIVMKISMEKCNEKLLY